jgi:opacity protein-like surface antigen
MNISKTLKLATLSLLASSTAMAMPNINVHQWMQTVFAHPVVTASGGFMTTSGAGESQTFQPINASTYAYNADRATHTQGILGGFIGSEFNIKPNVAMQIGVGYYQSLSFPTTGSIVQGPDAQSSDQYDYSYNITSRQLLVEGKLSMLIKDRLHPYVAAGLGASFNTAHEYKTNVPPFLTFSPAFSGNTSHGFTYTVGMGMDIDLMKNVRGGVGYRFSDLGRTDLGSAVIDVVPISNRYKQAHLYTHQFLAQLTYLLS